MQHVFGHLDQIKANGPAAVQDNDVLCVLPREAFFQLCLIRHMKLAHQRENCRPYQSVDELAVFQDARAFRPVDPGRYRHLKLGRMTPFMITF